MMNENLPCWVYRSPLKAEMYLFLARENGFDDVPDDLLTRFGNPIPVIELELNETRKLAREDVCQVMVNLRTRGYHLQMPPRLQPSMYHGNLD